MDYIKIMRQLEDWQWYKDTVIKSGFLHCLIKANWRERRLKGITIRRGQFPTSQRDFSYESGLSITSVKRLFETLQESGEIKIKSNNHGTIVTVCNYDLYQGSGGTEELTKELTEELTKELTERLTEELTEELAKGLAKELYYKKGKEEEKKNKEEKVISSEITKNKVFDVVDSESPHEVVNDYSLGGKLFSKTGKLKEPAIKYKWEFIESEEIGIIFSEWLTHKKVKGTSFTKAEKSVENQYKKLINLSSGKIDLALALVENAIDNGWTGLYALKWTKEENSVAKVREDLSGLKSGDVLTLKNLKAFNAKDVIVGDYFDFNNETTTESGKFLVKDIIVAIKLKLGKYTYLNIVK